MSIFEEVKTGVTARQAAAYLNLKFHSTENGKEGVQLRYACPFCDHADRHALSINEARGKFQCFRCKNGGSDIITLVAKLKNLTNTEAAKELKDQFLHRSTEPRPEKAEAKGRPGAVDSAAGVRPLDFHDWEHPVMDLLKISPAVIRAIGGGIDHTDLLDERLCIPLRMESGNLIGYLAIATKPDQKPLILFWPEDMNVYIEPEKRSQDEMRKLLRVV
ncbi:CHC2 zinc finger domain-containing protein [Bradyrhizobium sp. ORS 285]|uniref:CHC2 zinc finger domain-containing protein n=1 Tax=Bradyrhizobium sp. ORS 285 TaxID=115808 RepID=UPI0002E266CA|nr:CHC2 zinc finger domain-containing protein [Bradyrhizobium sp. ORS 285]